MTTMIERVAAAMCKADKGMLTSYESIARAAFQAMREPSEAMVAAGSDEMTNGKQTWQAMIDAALKDPA